MKVQAAVDEQTVAVLARLAGVEIPAQRRPEVAVRLAEMMAFAAELDDLDLDGVAPAAEFDPGWGGETEE